MSINLILTHFIYYKQNDKILCHGIKIFGE